MFFKKLQKYDSCDLALIELNLMHTRKAGSANRYNRYAEKKRAKCWFAIG